MKVLIIGCGVIGLSTAYFMHRFGHEVVVVDRDRSAGRQTSFANGALLTPGMSDPWNAPGCGRQILSSLFQSDSPLNIRLRALPTFAGWGIAFLRNSKPAIHQRNTIINLQLALESLGVLHDIGRETGIEYGGVATGSLKVFRDGASFSRARREATRMLPAGLRFRALTGHEIIDLEPALEPIVSQLSGAIYYETDETGDAYRYCVALAEHLNRMGVEFHFNSEITAFEMAANRAAAASGPQVRICADQYVIAAGCHSAALLRRIGMRLPINPVKGYSLTFESQRDVLLGLPIIDDHLHVAVVPLQDGLRAAGTAEFSGFDLSIETERIRSLARITQSILPQAALNPSVAKPWCGLRPMSADGVPIIGPTSVQNLWVNAGHGHLGWTMAAGSGKLLSCLLNGQVPSINPSPFAMARFL